MENILKVLSAKKALGLVILFADLLACRTMSYLDPTATSRPTHTPTAVASPVAVVVPSATETAQPTMTSIPTLTPRVVPALPTTTATPPTATHTPVATSVPPQPPLEGGTWDFEGGWYNRPSGFEGRTDRVAEGWNYFRRRGQYGQATFNENKNPVNVHRGIRSQELAFESSDGEAGLYRSIPVILNHRYTISAWGIHYPSPTPIELSLGIDLTGGKDYEAATVKWFPWDKTGEAIWLHTQVTIRASSPQMTIFLKAAHRVAASGGATLFDDVRVTDEGE